MFDNVSEGRRAELDGNIKEVPLGLLIEVSDNVGMIVGFLENANFSGGQRDKIPEETFDSDSTTL